MTSVYELFEQTSYNNANMQHQVSGMHIAHGLMHRCSQYFGLGGPNHKSHAITSSEIFEKREFLWAKNERSEAGGLVWHIIRILLNG